MLRPSIRPLKIYGDHIPVCHPGCLGGNPCRLKAHQNVFVFVINFGLHILLFSAVLNLEAVSHSPNRFNVLRLGRVTFNFFPNLFDMNRNRCNIPY